MDIKNTFFKKHILYRLNSLVMRAGRLLSILSLLVLLIAGCSNQAQKEEAATKIVCAAGNGGITLPEGFCATLVIDSLGLRDDHSARHIAVAPNGDIYVKTRSQEGGIAALRDTTGDFRADIIEYFGDMTGTGDGILWETGIAIHDGYLWASNTVAVYRWPMPEGNALIPEGEPEIVVSGFPEQQSHASKSFAFDGRGHLYVSVGAPSNACQEQERTNGSPGIEPCPLLEEHGGIWRFDANQTGQTFSADARYATGLRNVVGLDWNVAGDALYVMQHGRDQLHTLWPDFYTVEESAELPSEAMYKVNEGDRFGWPYGYYDHLKDTLMLSPEYGGNGKITISESKYAGEFEEPVIGFPGHWAPNDLLFYTGEQFPERYRGGAFIAFIGSWNRAPLPQKGYKIAFVPFRDGQPSGDYETFADGFAGVEPIPDRGAAEYRPTGLALGPDGALYISDYKKGRIWRVVYTGKAAPADDTTVSMPADTTGTPSARTAAASSLTGEALFRRMECATCHTVDPNAPASTGPSLYDLYGSEVTLQNGRAVMADEAYLRESILQAGAKIVAGYMPVMPSYEGQLMKEELSLLVSYMKSL
ncbi:glucose/arabinose dehydrogenase [Anseongella ginsenosidimutans]|uniref:Glucose/arabinose dehydrogenase n=1 Tax=Anseongella ginsenosidimutans TaxID=496056 RepID=A0A4R3KL59_9SPHI|nr:PQQ-dependent sugar dehydrogenase [Anseongella ginsenosidimutans]QEC52803.1 c-type cytochrome [Anseongella ginsenosidimutans]TCS84697.1 glucose/arabinose dehydrogenase [Anseongella ginsenosidimutans]